MVDLAKFVEIYEGAPDKVSKGKQAIVKVFAESIKKKWESSDAQFNELYFKKIVALAIIFNETDDIVKQTSWWKEKRSYKANVVAYAMSVLFNEIHTNHRGYNVDFGKIWSIQTMYPELKEQIKILCDEVYDFITRDDRLTENVTEWCKKEACWTRAKAMRWTFSHNFMSTLISQDELAGEIKEAKSMQKVANEVDTLKYIIAAGSEYWQQVLDWGNKRGLLTDMEQSILRLVINIPKTGRTPSDKQAKVVIRARERLISEGMPLQF